MLYPEKIALETQTNIHTISHGPRFGGPLSWVALFAAIPSFIFGVITVVNYDDWGVGLTAMSIGLLGVNFFLDIRGVQLNLAAKQYRKYRWFFGLKYGSWKSLAPYMGLALRWQRQSYRTGFFLMPTQSTSDSYFVFLENDNPDDQLELGEFDSHQHARDFMRKYASLFNLPFVDHYHARVESAQRRRELYGEGPKKTVVGSPAKNPPPIPLPRGGRPS